MLRYVIVAVCVLLLSGCAQQEFLTKVANPKQAYKLYKQQLYKLHTWHSTGQVSLVSSKQALEAEFNWQQLPGSYRIILSGVLGLGQVIISKTRDGKFSYLAANGKTYYAQTAQAFMQRELGWSVPISGLSYWFRGVPIPNHPYQYKLNAYGALSSLQQAGWRVRYYHYLFKDGVPVPGRIVVIGQGLRLTLAVSALQSL